MSRPLYFLMTLSGITLGFFIAFSEEPVAGAVVGGLLSIVSAAGLYFTEHQATANSNKRFTTTALAMTCLYVSMLVSFFASLGISYRYVPSSIEQKHSILTRFLQGSGLTAVEVSGQRYDLSTAAGEAAAALLLTSETLAADSDRLRLFASGTGGSTVQTTPQAAFCPALVVALGQKPIDRNDVSKALQQNTVEALVIGRLLNEIPTSNYEDAARFVGTTYCPTGG